MILLIECNFNKKDKNNITFYNSNGEVLKVINLIEVKDVNWNEQCYHFEKSFIEELNQLDIIYGRVELMFGKQILISAETYNISYPVFPKNYFILLDEYGKIVFEEDYLCFANSEKGMKEILNNRKYYNYLKQNGLVREE